jgi:hypothetical protein
MTKDDEPTPEELRDAEALARALDGATPKSAPPPEALEVAALLRHAKSGGELDPARAQAIAAGLRADVRPPRRRRWLWIAAPLAVGAAGLLLLPSMLMLRTGPVGITGPRSRALPAPPASLLAAQAEAARGQPRALAELDAQMRAYRRALFREGGR